MHYQRVFLEAMGYEIAPTVVSSAWIEEQLASVYAELRIQPGQLEALTGIRERHWWDEGFSNAEGATRAARHALAATAVKPGDLGALIYGGVSRDHIEPATACAVAEAVGVGAQVEIYDISNACLGVLNGMVAIANRIELGHIRAGIVVSCESSREITSIMIKRLLQSRSMESFNTTLATLTVGSGAVAMVLSDGSFGKECPRLLGGALQTAPQHHALCRWESNGYLPGGPHEVMETDSIAVLKHGTALGVETWERFLRDLGWTREAVDRVVCHQVGTMHREAVLKAFGMPPVKDFSTFEYFGNMGTVSLPMTAALAAERGFLQRGHRVGFLGIGSGLNCLMLGWQW